MWCNLCERDVLGVARVDTGALACARCGSHLSLSKRERKDRQHADAARTPKMKSFDWQEWELDDLDPMPTETDRDFASRSRIAELHGAVASPHLQSPLQTDAEEVGEIASLRTPFTCWLLLTSGIGTFVCGGVLLLWSYFGDRPDLWAMGMPLAIFGQAIFLIGLVLQLDVIWQSSRDTAEALDSLDNRVQGMNRKGAKKHDVHQAHSLRHNQTRLTSIRSQLDQLSKRG